MAVISDYLEWRGDLRFDQAPFNEVDNYIISKIGCPDLTGIVPADASSVGIGEAVQTYFGRPGITEKSLGVLASEEILKTLKKLPDTERFRELRLSGYRRCTDVGANKQFSALTVHMPDGTSYVSFRGTDDSIVGWKENFLMAVMDVVPAQEEALAYLHWAAEAYAGPLIVGGHSKGGNLALFAAARAGEEIQRRILAVYNNDGPGFNQTFFEDPGFQKILDRTHYIVPQHSLIGTLLLQPCDFEVVKCPHTGIGSHDGFGWEVTRDHFVKADGLSRLSSTFNVALERQMENMTKEETSEFIDQLFDVLCTRGAENLTDLTDQKLGGLFSTLKSLRKETKVYSLISEVAERMLKDIRRDVLPVEDWKKKIIRPQTGAKHLSENDGSAN